MRCAAIDISPAGCRTGVAVLVKRLPPASKVPGEAGLHVHGQLVTSVLCLKVLAQGDGGDLVERRGEGV